MGRAPRRGAPKKKRLEAGGGEDGGLQHLRWGRGDRNQGKRPEQPPSSVQYKDHAGHTDHEKEQNIKELLGAAQLPMIVNRQTIKGKSRGFPNLTRVQKDEWGRADLGEKENSFA